MSEIAVTDHTTAAPQRVTITNQRPAPRPSSKEAELNLLIREMEVEMLRLTQILTENYNQQKDHT